MRIQFLYLSLLRDLCRFRFRSRDFDLDLSLFRSASWFLLSSTSMSNNLQTSAVIDLILPISLKFLFLLDRPTVFFTLVCLSQVLLWMITNLWKHNNVTSFTGLYISINNLNKIDKKQSESGKCNLTIFLYNYIQTLDGTFITLTTLCLSEIHKPVFISIFDASKCMVSC